VSGDANRTKTREFCEENDLRFPTLVDQDAKIGQMFQVTSTPTVLVIGPDGVIDSVIVSGQADFAKAIEDTKRKAVSASGGNQS
jgi:peroxiredoxin